MTKTKCSDAKVAWVLNQLYANTVVISGYTLLWLFIEESLYCCHYKIALESCLVKICIVVIIKVLNDSLEKPLPRRTQGLWPRSILTNNHNRKFKYTFLAHKTPLKIGSFLWPFPCSFNEKPISEAKRRQSCLLSVVPYNLDLPWSWYKKVAAK